jgi:predicted AlkP superfamily phosphohydrolase/phosphomutase
MGVPSVRKRRHMVPVVLSLALLIVSATLPGATSPAVASTKARSRTIVLGFDGMDPRLAEQWMDDGSLPHFARLRERGHYQALQTTNPAQSPVAWATFATGLDPGSHGIFDFLHRDPATYGPKYSITAVEPPERFIGVFGWQLPLDSGAIRTQRSGTAFWTTAERHGRAASVLRVPATYPADPITRMLSGMGVPDLLGTQGTFTIYTTKAGVSSSSDEGTGARIIPVVAEAGRIETTFSGPMHPLRKAAEPITLPLNIVDLGSNRVRVELGGATVELQPGEWSEWQPLRFRFLGFMGVPGIVRIHLARAFPDLQLYVSPIHFDPRDPAGPMASPLDYAGELAERIGLFHTLGMAEETWSLNEEQISDAAWLDMVRTVLAEREAMLFDTLDRGDSDLVVAVFVQTDRVSHMFWRGLDPTHPMHGTVDQQGRDAIRWIYGEADRILGRTLEAMGPDDRLIVLSDHGFSSFRRGVNLNRWLVEQGFMALKPGQPVSDSLLSNVDWTRTRAYAIGLNSLFINRYGREALGIVRDEDVAALKAQIRERLLQLRDPKDSSAAVATVADADEIYEHSHHAAVPDLLVGYAAGYRASWSTALGGVPEALIEENAKKWSGDHLIEPSLVPGVLFTSFPLEEPITSIGDVPSLVKQVMSLDGALPASSMAPSRGWLDLASPVLSWFDRLLAKFLPDLLRIALWSVLAGFLSMLVYKWTSNQKRLANLKKQAIEIQGRLKGFEGEMDELWPILRRNMSVAWQRLGLGLLPAVIASVPVVFILAWMSNAFDARFPLAGKQVSVTAIPDATHQLPPMRWQGSDVKTGEQAGTWTVAWPAESSPLRLVDSDGTVVLTLPTTAPVSTVHQRRWWNNLVGNPAGYLPSPGDIDAVSLDLPGVEFLGFGPSWLRSWLTLFFLVVIATSLGLKSYWRLH